MKEIKSLKKTNTLKKILIKICRLFGYELIDQSTLKIPISNKNLSDQLTIPGKSSFSIGLGETKITRKVVAIDIIVKTCTSVQLVSQNKKRIFEKEKSEYTFRSIKSLYNSAINLKKSIPNIKIKFILIDVNSPESDRQKMRTILEGFQLKFISLDVKKFNFEFKPIDKDNKEFQKNMTSTMASIHKSFELAKSSEDLIYFVEDDYIHKTETLTEMVLSFEKFASIFNKDLFLLSTDYPFLYKKLENSKLLVGEKYHWRTVQESLLTFLTSSKMICNHYNRLSEMAKIENDPFEKNLHEIYKDEICLSPIPSLSLHCTNINSVFGLSPNINIEKLWNESDH